MEQRLYIDAGIEYIKVGLFDFCTDTKKVVKKLFHYFSNNDRIEKILLRPPFASILNQINDYNLPVFITGKLAEVVKTFIGQGYTIMPSAALWSAAKFYIDDIRNPHIDTLGILDLSASGFTMIGIQKNGQLKNDLLIVNPRCGAGTGINLNRILEKLDVNRNDVDQELCAYLGKAGFNKRREVPIRSDRCGVFSSSATISDKNQGIPLDYALAITMKSEVTRACEKMMPNIDVVYLTGGVFRWQFARDCAIDIFKSKGINNIHYDSEQSVFLDGICHLSQHIAKGEIVENSHKKLRLVNSLRSIPSFQLLHKKYTEASLYHRAEDLKPVQISSTEIENKFLNIGLDIGSTMAKIVISDAKTGAVYLIDSCKNNGDTIETVKFIFNTLKQKGIERLKIQNFGITGSGRYQVQKTLQSVYPHLENHIFVMVENYAHVYGSSHFAKDHIETISVQYNRDLNKDFCLLIDIGGEDTKISVIALQKNELYDNAMNIKCSAGTGSLMDTISTMFGIKHIEDAYLQAFQSERAYEINATCAVFLMENGRTMQAEGYSKDEIMASCAHAIVENMVRSLWDQIDFPENCLVLLHGQTMLSEPLPLAVTHRIQEYTAKDTYCLIPPNPGHRACFGLIEAMKRHKNPYIEHDTSLDVLLDYQFDKKVVICRAALCGDKNSRCARTRLSSTSAENNFSVTLGGCAAINEIKTDVSKYSQNTSSDAYHDIWNFINSQLPESENKNRIVIPRSFAISEVAYLFSRILTHLKLPVHVDNVQEMDILTGQPFFSIDTCAPNIGATGQFIRLAGEPHGMILVPQIEFLPTKGDSLGRTCTTNQGGVQIAQHNAQYVHPKAHFYLFDISLKDNEANTIADHLYLKLQKVFEFYNLEVTRAQFAKIIEISLQEQDILTKKVEDLTADHIRSAIENKQNISVISAREYILNPGIYDSHVGKILRDKNVAAIPIYVFDVKPDKQFDFIYWKNPNLLLSKINAIVNKEFHRIIKNKDLSDLIKLIEMAQTDTQLSVVTVSTFRCGPDSITLPIESEITKSYPTLLIQSDAMIAELAHLENRINTHLNQVKNSLHDEIKKDGEHKFSIEILNDLNLNGQSKDECIIYFPTMGDNRTLSTIFRAAGYTTVDNFDDHSFNLEQKVRAGRKQLGDSVCVPLSAVYSDMIEAVEDFKRKKQSQDPLVKGKDKIILFMQTGDGPCRQGQYLDICKLNVYKKFVEKNSEVLIKFFSNTTTSLHTEKDFLSELEKWAALQVYHIVVIKDVLHSIFIKFVSNCTSIETYEKFVIAHQQLKREVYDLIEHKMKPGKNARQISAWIDNHISPISGIAKYLLFGFYKNNGLRRIFKKFNRQWNRIISCSDPESNEKSKIYVDGEIYLRMAQIEEILKLLIDLRGFNWFNFLYAPMWSYFEYIVEQRIILANDDIKKYDKMQKFDISKEEWSSLDYLKNIESEKIKEAKYDSQILRNILARPLYKAAGLPMPHPVRDYISEARKVIPTLKPEGELIPFIGATMSEINMGADLVLNVAPEGCMVSAMGEMLSPAISKSVQNGNARIQHMSSIDGEINRDVLELALLKILGPIEYYRSIN
jgi:activator of 2-hydroxyglutaryl-CoA dehydratase/predicted nucleotide-binding protein (sugar kinase/HSP70/actin superfamily)